MKNETPTETAGPKTRNEKNNQTKSNGQLHTYEQTSYPENEKIEIERKPKKIMTTNLIYTT